MRGCCFHCSPLPSSVSPRECPWGLGHVSEGALRGMRGVSAGFSAGSPGVSAGVSAGVSGGFPGVSGGFRANVGVFWVRYAYRKQ